VILSLSMLRFCHDQVDQTLGFLDQLKEQHHEVASKTRQLHDKCERLVRHLSCLPPVVYGIHLIDTAVHRRRSGTATAVRA